MLTKTLIITGAGFSHPAHLPIQSRIIDEMLSKLVIKDELRLYEKNYTK